MSLVHRVSIAWQLTILAVVIAGGAIWILSAAVLDRGRDVLLTHEIVDLGDEANLRVYELRDQVRHLQWQLREVARHVGTVFHDGLAGRMTPRQAVTQPRLLETWRREWARILQPPAEAGDDEQRERAERDRLHRRHLDGSAIGDAFLYSLGKTREECVPLAIWRTGATDFEVPAGAAQVPASVAELASPRFFDAQTPAFSHPALEPVRPAQPDSDRRCYVTLIVPVWVKDNQAHYALVVRVDLTQYFLNMARVSARHFFILTNYEWTILVHPEPAAVGTRFGSGAEASWHFRIPERQEGRPPGEEEWLPAFDVKTERRMMGTGGVRLRDPNATPGQGGDEPSDARIEMGRPYRFLHTETRLPEYDEYLFHRLNQVLVEQSREVNGDLPYPVLRFVEPSDEGPNIQLSHPDLGVLRRVQAAIRNAYLEVNQRRAGEGKPPLAPPEWSEPLDCHSFTAHLVRARLSSYAGDRGSGRERESQFQLILVASVEEIQDDIEGAIGEVRTRWGVGALLGAGVLALLMARWLIRPLKRMTHAVERLASGSGGVHLKVQGPSEVQTLARAFQSMAVQIEQRREELNRNLERMRTILKTAAEGIIVFNHHGRILEANLAAVQMFGYPDERAIQNVRADEMLELPMKLADPGQSSVHRKREGESVHAFDEVLRMPSEIRRGLRADGSTFWIEVAFSKIEQQRLYTGIFRDVSARKEAEEMRAVAERGLKDLNLRLDQRVSERTSELAEAKGRLEVALDQARAAMRAKDTFVANMSHELRQPLHIIIGFTEALREEMEAEGQALAVNDLNKILAAAKHLLDLINDLLDLAKIAAGKMDLALGRVELGPLVEMLRTLAQPLMEKNRNTLRVALAADLQPMVSDERRVKQILFNLLSNAAKFTSGGSVELRVEARALDGRDGILFQVIDTGKGMSPEQVARLFQRFYQVDDSTTRQQGGTGLGLAITQSICELMSGTIEVTSVVDAGTTFRIWLPRVLGGSEPPRRAGPGDAERHAPAPPPPAAPGGGPECRRVLVIDDDERVRELMHRFLAKEGFDVRTAGGGVEGLQVAREFHPSVITLDVMMPGIDGWGILAVLKSDAALRDIPVVIVSIVDDRNRGIALGASDYINKPIDWPSLSSILQRHLRGREPRSVLIIDDDAEFRQVLCCFFQSEKVPVVEAGNGREGLERFRQHQPALILLDLAMPEMDGVRFVQVFREEFPDSQVPIVVLTGGELQPADYERLGGGVSRVVNKVPLPDEDGMFAQLRQEIHRVLPREHR